MAMLQFELMAVVPVGAGVAGGQGLQQPASLLGCGGVALGGHVPGIKVDVGQPRLKRALVQRALASLLCFSLHLLPEEGD